MSDTQSFGFRDLFLYVDLCPPHCVSCECLTKSCSECITGLMLSGTPANCNCNPGFYSDKYTNQCLPCNKNCLTCSNKDICITCISSRFQDPPNCTCLDGLFGMDDYSSICVVHCPFGFYPNPISK